MTSINLIVNSISTPTLAEVLEQAYKNRREAEQFLRDSKKEAVQNVVDFLLANKGKVFFNRDLAQAAGLPSSVLASALYDFQRRHSKNTIKWVKQPIERRFIELGSDGNPMSGEIHIKKDWLIAWTAVS